MWGVQWEWVEQLRKEHSLINIFLAPLLTLVNNIGFTFNVRRGRHQTRGRMWSSGRIQLGRGLCNQWPRNCTHFIPVENYQSFTTLLGVPSFAKFWRWGFGEFPRLVGSYCSYQLPKQTQISIFKSLRMTGRPTVYTHMLDNIVLCQLSYSSSLTMYSMYFGHLYLK